LLVGSVGTVEAKGHLTVWSPSASESDTWSYLLVAVAFAVFCVYTLVMISATAMIVGWTLRTARGPVAPTQRVGTDRVQLVAYWDMELVRLRGIAKDKGFIGGSSVTKKFLVCWLIEQDNPWLQCCWPA